MLSLAVKPLAPNNKLLRAASNSEKTTMKRKTSKCRRHTVRWVVRLSKKCRRASRRCTLKLRRFRVAIRRVSLVVSRGAVLRETPIMTRKIMALH